MKKYNIILGAIFLSLLLWCVLGCSTIKKSWAKTETKSDSTRVVKVDSSGTKNTKEVYTKETITYYRDTAIYLPGNPVPIYIPTNTIIRETGQKDVAETANKSGSDSTANKEEKKADTKNTEKSGMDIISKIIIGGIVLLLIAFIVLFFYLKGALKIKPFPTTIP